MVRFPAASAQRKETTSCRFWWSGFRRELQWRKKLSSAVDQHRTAKIFFRYQYSRPGLSKPSHPPLLHIQNESGQVDLPNHFIVSFLGQIRRSIIKNLANPNVLELGLNIRFFFMCIYLEYNLILALTFYLFIYYQQECVKIVDADVSRHKHCTEEYFDYWRCVEKCVVPKLFEKLTYWKENSKAGVIKP
ncbi:hypothetical protein LXL04_006744 [Taraxacum kok-saghyz]